MAYITAQDVKAIREELKVAFPKWKFSVRKGSGSLALSAFRRTPASPAGGGSRSRIAVSLAESCR